MLLKIMKRAAVVLAAFAAALPAVAAEINPPWIDTPTGGKEFHLAGVNDIADLHGDIVDPQLVVYFAGNQFMVTGDLMKAFRKKYPRYKRIYWQTLPPGIQADQIEQGALIMGALRIAHQPDVYTGGHARIIRMKTEKGWFDRTVDYARNRLAIMAAKGNPEGIKGLKDLGRSELMVAMPNPEWEGIGNVIIRAFKKAGGRELVDRVMRTKKEAGTTFMTRMHHRQTPMRIMEGKSDCGPTWYTEPFFQQKIGNPIGMVEIPDEINEYVTYTAAGMKNAPHARAARDFLNFLASKEGQAIYREYGFLPPE